MENITEEFKNKGMATVSVDFNENANFIHYVNLASQDVDDSRLGNLLHIKRVNDLLICASMELLKRAQVHDNSKLTDPELSIFNTHGKVLMNIEYGSQEYFDGLDLLAPAIEHHYKVNSHHPQFYENGIDDFNLFDLIEMFFDWKASSERHSDGNLDESITINAKRFNINEQLVKILRNTLNSIGHAKL